MWIKICGITREADVTACVRAGVSAIGLNFYLSSPRRVTVGRATELSQLASSTAAHMERIGVFVNAPINEIVNAVQMAGLTGIQLHGDEPPDVLQRLRADCPDTGICRAFRVDETNICDVDAWLQQSHAIGATPDRILIDARVGGAYGGTGVTAPWELIAGHPTRLSWPPLILAGGLNPENVAAAIELVHPFGVDTASGVEESAGVKSAGLIESFAKASGRPSPA